jgi:hypothetical protein
MSFALLKNDLDWLGRLDDQGLWYINAKQVLAQWYKFIENRSTQSIDEHDTEIQFEIKRLVRDLYVRLNHYLE